MHSSHRSHNNLYQANPKQGTWSSARRTPKRKHRIDWLRYRIRTLDAHIQNLDTLRQNGKTWQGGIEARDEAVRERNRHKRELDMLADTRTTAPRLKPRIRKVSDERALQLVRDAITAREARGMTFVTREIIVCETHLHMRQVDKAFMALNREGRLTQGKNRKHEDFEWVATDYTILDPKGDES